jgi:hypothetical protein
MQNEGARIIGGGQAPKSLAERTYEQVIVAWLAGKLLGLSNSRLELGTECYGHVCGADSDNVDLGSLVGCL